MWTKKCNLLMKTKPKIIHVAAALNAIFVFSRNTGPHFVLDRKHGLQLLRQRAKPNLVPGASFRFIVRKAKKRPWNTLSTSLAFAQVEGIFFRINYGTRGRRYLRTSPVRNCRGLKSLSKSLKRVGRF